MDSGGYFNCMMIYTEREAAKFVTDFLVECGEDVSDYNVDEILRKCVAINVANRELHPFNLEKIMSDTFNNIVAEEYHPQD